jgi:hypothetical protein
MARTAVRGDWDGFLTGGGGSGGAPTDAEYVVMSLNGTLTDERVLTAGSRITITDGGAGGNVTIAADASPVTSLIAGTNITLSPISGLGDVTINASGEIGGTITNDQIARGATAANDIEGSNGLLFDGTSFTINTLSASDPIVNIGSSTKAVSLEVNTNQKLSIKGSSNSFVFDASSATGGITFPDSTVQNTAASAGTNYVIDSLVSETPTTFVVPILDNLCNQGGTGYGNRNLTVETMTDVGGSFLYYRSFNASKTGTLSAVLNRAINSTGGAAIKVAFYNSDSDGNPQTLIGQASIDMSSFASSKQTSITPETTGSMDLTKGDLYWVGIGNDGGGSGATSTGYFTYETKTLGTIVAVGAVGTGTFEGFTHLIGAFTPPTTFVLLSTGQRQAMALGGLYS